MRRVKRTPLVIAVVLGVLVLWGTARADLTDGLIAHWKFDEGEGYTSYDSAGSNDGFIYGAQWAGGALSFDGANAYVDMADTVKSYLGTSYTVSAWVMKKTIFTIDVVTAYRHSLSGPPVLFNLALSEANVEWAVRDNSGKIAKAIYPDVITVGKWYHIAGVREGNNLKIYVNGVSGISDSETFGAISPNNLKVGAFQFDGNPPQRFFDGTIDDVRIYDRALSGEEIEELYQETLPVLSGLEIAGPAEAAENFQTQYRAIAHYENGSGADVTDFANWSVEPNDIANVNSGLLATETAASPTDITITAEYSEGENIQEAHKQVLIQSICPSGSTLEFDGIDDFVDMGDSVKNYLEASYTVSAWVRTNTVSSIEVVAAYRHSISGNPVLFNFALSKANVEWAVRDDSGKIAKAIYPNVITAGKWYHVAGVREGTIVNVYVNGVSGIADSETLGTINPDNLKVGAFEFGGNPLSRQFDGSIDDLRIYSRALSAEEIRAIMHTRPGGDDPNLVGCWDFDEGEGQLVNDISGKGNEGMLGSTSEADESDPAWVDSDAPVGICTAKGLVERNLLRVWDIKETILELLEDAIVTEDATKGFLDELFESGEMGEFKNNDVAKAKKKIHSAIQEEEQASTAVDKSIEKLDDALNTLGIE